MPRYAYLTCELKSRDLDSRLLIAAHLLKRGVSVVVGQLWSMIAGAHQAPKGVFLFKTANNIQIGLAEHVKGHGHRSAFMDEESLALVSPYLVRLFTPPKALTVADTYFFLNETHRTILKGSGPVVGSPRIDLLRRYRSLYQAEADACRARGRYVLINTNFALHNCSYAAPEKQIDLLLQGGSIEGRSEEGRAYIQSWLDTERLNMAAMHELVGRIRHEIGDCRIVVRPHPTEDTAAWQAYSGIEVVAGSAAVPWMLGAEVVVHTNSTTGLEAAFLGRPTLNLNPAPHAYYSSVFATNTAAFQAADAGGAIEKIRAVLDGTPVPQSEQGLPVFPDNAAGAIAADMAGLAPESGALTSWIRLPRNEMQMKKFTVTVEETARRIETFGRALGIPGVQLSALDDSLFLLTARAA